MRIKHWKQVFIEDENGNVLAIESQQYPVGASNYDILSLRDKEGWNWINTHSTWPAKTNGKLYMRVHFMYEVYERWYEKAWKKFTKNWVHFFK